MLANEGTIKAIVEDVKKFVSGIVDTLTSTISSKLDKSGGTMTGNICFGEEAKQSLYTISMGNSLDGYASGMSRSDFFVSYTDNSNVTIDQVMMHPKYGYSHVNKDYKNNITKATRYQYSKITNNNKDLLLPEESGTLARKEDLETLAHKEDLIYTRSEILGEGIIDNESISSSSIIEKDIGVLPKISTDGIDFKIVVQINVTSYDKDSVSTAGLYMKVGSSSGSYQNCILTFNGNGYYEEDLTSLSGNFDNTFHIGLKFVGEAGTSITASASIVKRWVEKRKVNEEFNLINNKLDNFEDAMMIAKKKINVSYGVSITTATTVTNNVKVITIPKSAKYLYFTGYDGVISRSSNLIFSSNFSSGGGGGGATLIFAKDNTTIKDINGSEIRSSSNQPYFLAVNVPKNKKIDVSAYAGTDINLLISLTGGGTDVNGSATAKINSTIVCFECDSSYIQDKLEELENAIISLGGTV